MSYRLDGISDQTALATGATTVKAALTARYGTAAKSVAMGVVARAGSGTVTLKDTKGNTLEAISLDAAGVDGTRELVFQFTEITALSGITSVEIYA